MSQPYEYHPHPPPPPPPPPPPGPPPPASHGLPAARRRPRAPALTTNLAGGVTPSLTPHTPVVLSSRTPSALVPPTPQAATPMTPMEPYDPRQWSARGQVSGTQMVFQQRTAGSRPASIVDVSGHEVAMPSPPPPYSPDDMASPRPQRHTPVLENMGFSVSPLAAEVSARSSPQVAMSPGFPPPPPQSSRYRERSTSGLANQLGFFSRTGRWNKQPMPADAPSATNPAIAPTSLYAEPRPPSSIRAASTGHMQVNAALPGSSRGSQRSSPERSWQPGMPLPGPPPGPPPPSGMRSQSLNRVPGSSSSHDLTADLSGSTTQHRRTISTRPTLGPVPPTPANWLDSDHPPPESRQPSPQPPLPTQLSEQSYEPLRINTGAGNIVSETRRPPRREVSGPGIRERRSRSRATREVPNDESSSSGNDSKPANLVLSTTEGTLSQRRGHGRVGSIIAGPFSAPIAAENVAKPMTSPAFRSANNVSTPNTPGKAGDDSLKRRSAVRVAPGSASSDRPMSHLLHAQNPDDSSVPVSSSPAHPPSRAQSSNSRRSSSRLDQFYLKAMERHRAFIEKEASAATDEERLELFAGFMVNESRLRRDRYATAYSGMAGDIVDLTRDMWRSYTQQSRRAATPSTSMSSVDPNGPSWASDGQPNSAQGNFPSSASSVGDFTPATESGSMGDIGENAMRSESRQWAEGFKPSLSPIPSMAVSTANDGDSSRGRKSSRWWEDNSGSGSGSGSIGKPGRIEKSHRETKYMGVSPAALQETDQPAQGSSDASRYTPPPGVNAQYSGYGPNEYPPEKVGWHDSSDFETPVPTPAHVRERKTSSPGMTPLDVSRLVTLPPPYPRHHPAINNSHPLLSDLRNEHRALADNSRIREIKDAYMEKDFIAQKRQQDEAKERRQRLRASIQRKISENVISFAEAAQAESDFDAEEAERGKANARSNFDLFEASVAHPLNDLLTAHLQKAESCLTQLRVELESRNEALDPNQAQEEGDEQPERLEKLTLMKWLFETREQLHREMFDFHAERSTKYSEVVLTPFRIARLQAKIDDATAFFARDAAERQASFAKDALRRFEDFQTILEANVSRGVEDQLSAFWDIAPGLREVIQHIPAASDSTSIPLEILIPPLEYEENPAYDAHPLQYLYSLLAHAERSAYQFIESQTNMLCLLHEVRTATTKASLRLLESERHAAEPSQSSSSGKAAIADDDSSLANEIRSARSHQEDRLTRDLQDKVGEVERQWREALGDALEERKVWVRASLEHSGGWEDGLE